MKYFEDDHATINIFEEDKLIEVIWKRVTADSSNYKFTLSKALVAIKQYDVNRWISDMGRVEIISEEDRVWIRSVWVPEVAEYIKKASFIINQAIYDKKSAENLIGLAGKSGILLKYFLNEGEAYKWIKE